MTISCKCLQGADWAIIATVSPMRRVGGLEKERWSWSGMLVWGWGEACSRCELRTTPSGPALHSSHHLISRPRHWAAANIVVPVADTVDVQRPNAEARKRGFETVQDVADVEKTSLGFSSQDCPRASAQHYPQRSSHHHFDRNERTRLLRPMPHHYSIAWLGLRCQFSVRRFSVESLPPRCLTVWLNGKPCISMNFP